MVSARILTHTTGTTKGMALHLVGFTGLPNERGGLNPQIHCRVCVKDACSMVKKGREHKATGITKIGSYSSPLDTFLFPRSLYGENVESLVCEVFDIDAKYHDDLGSGKIVFKTPDSREPRLKYNLALYRMDKKKKMMMHKGMLSFELSEDLVDMRDESD